MILERSVYLLLALACACPAAAQAEPDLRISVVTFGRGDAIHQYFGHNAFVVDATGLPEVTVVNYGMFSFGPDMIPQFLRGRLRFWVGASELQRTAASYRAQNRDVRLRQLNLEPQAARTVLARLQHDLQPEHREYLYDHYWGNCSTRVRDVLDAALGGQLRRAWSRRARFNLREQTALYTHPDPIVQWAMMLGLNASVDRPQDEWSAAFLPDRLEQLLDTTRYRDSRGLELPLVAARKDLFLAHRAPLPAAPVSRVPGLLALGLALSLAFGLLGWRAAGGGRLARSAFTLCCTLYGVATGLVGSLLLHLWCFSDHLVAHRNANLLLVSPLALVAAVASGCSLSGAAWAERWARVSWSLIGLGSCALLALRLFGLQQDVSSSLALLAPAQLGLALVARRVWRAPRAQRVAAGADLLGPT